MENIEHYKIVYSNHFNFEGKIFAFRKQLLFDITFCPNYKPIQANGTSKGWMINRKWLSVTKAKGLANKRIPIEIDVSDLQWCTQIELDKCFNLEK